MRIYGLRHWVEQSYKQVKDELGWADFQVRSDIAIRRHQVLVNCAFCFCWDAWLTSQPPPGPAPASPQERGRCSPVSAAPDMLAHPSGTKLSSRTARRPQLADPRNRAHALVAGRSKAPPPAELQRLLDSASAVTACSSICHLDSTDYRC